MWFMMMCVLGSVLTLSFSTLSEFKVDLNSCEIHDHLLEVANEGEFEKSVVDFSWTKNCSLSLHDVEDQLRKLYEDHINDTLIEVDATHKMTPVMFEGIIKQIHDIPQMTKRHPIIVYLDAVLLGVFTIEFILRLIVCPSAKAVFMSFLNLMDVIVLVSAFAELIIELYFPSKRFTDKGVKILFYLQMLRVMRVVRYVKRIPSVRVLGYTVKNSYKDLTVLLVFIFLGIILFSNFVYFAEDEKDFPSIPASWWWGIITMTTVGYGDMAPKTPIGKVIGSMCALSGVLVLSLTIPIFVNTFVTLYNYSHVHERFEAGKHKMLDKVNSLPDAQTSFVNSSFTNSELLPNGSTDATRLIVDDKNNLESKVKDDTSDLRLSNGNAITSTMLQNGHVSKSSSDSVHQTNVEVELLSNANSSSKSNLFTVLSEINEDNQNKTLSSMQTQYL